MSGVLSNASQQTPQAETKEEPSMEEILASIREIIADDEQPDDGLSERERYTHPTDHSNSNAAETGNPDKGVDSVSPQDQVMIDMEAAMEAELGSMADDMTASEALPVAAAAATAVVAASQTPDKPLTLAQRAERVKAEIAAAGEGLTLDERLAKYRIRGKSNLEQLAETVPARPQPVAAPIAAPVAAPVAPPVAASVQPVAPAPVAAVPILPTTAAIAEQMAASMMEEKAKEIEGILGDLMRPIVRTWLANNLPSLVEKLVREEIERVSNGPEAKAG